MPPILASTLAAAGCLGYASCLSFFNSSTQDSKPQTPDAQPQSDSEAPMSYNVRLSAAYAQKEFKEKFASYHARQQCFGADLARAAYETCNTIKEQHQEQTSGIRHAFNAMRNWANYGAMNGLYDQPAKENKTAEEIAYSALKNLGLEVGLENDGFTGAMEVWGAIRNSAPHVYPENITPEMIAVYKAQKPPLYLMEINDRNLDIDVILMTGRNSHAQAADAAIKSPRSGKFLTAYDHKIKAAYIQKEFKEKYAGYHSQQQCFGAELAREVYEISAALRAQTEIGLQIILSMIGDAVASILGYKTGFDRFAPGVNVELLAYVSLIRLGEAYGLENNGFLDTMKVWHVVRKSGLAPDVYPENITSEMVAVYKALDKAQSEINNMDVDAILKAGQSYTSSRTLNPLANMPDRIDVRV